MRLFDKEKQNWFLCKNIIDIGSPNLKIFFHKDLVDLADLYLKKELKIKEIKKEHVEEDKETMKKYRSEGKYFLFSNP